MRLWDVAKKGRCLHTFEGLSGQEVSVCLSADGQYALSGSWDMQLWDVASGRCLRVFGSVEQLGGLRQLECGRTARAVRKLGHAVVGCGQRTLLAHVRGARRAFSLSERGRAVRAFGGGEWDKKEVKLWEAETGRLLRTFEGHTEKVNSVCFSPDGQRSLSGSRDGTLKLWEALTGCCLRTFDEHTDGVRSVCLDTRTQYALSGSEDGTLKLWEVGAFWGRSEAPIGAETQKCRRCCCICPVPISGLRCPIRPRRR